MWDNIEAYIERELKKIEALNEPVADRIARLNEFLNEVEAKLEYFSEIINDLIVDFDRSTCQKCDGTGEVKVPTNYPHFIIDKCPDCGGTGED